MECFLDNLYNAVHAYQNGESAQAVFNTLALENEYLEGNPLKMSKLMVGVGCQMAYNGGSKNAVTAMDFAYNLVQIAVEDPAFNERELLDGYEEIMTAMLTHKTMLSQDIRRDSFSWQVFLQMAREYYLLETQEKAGRAILTDQFSKGLRS